MKQKITSVAIVLLLLCAAAQLAPATNPATAPADAGGEWEGAIELPGQELRVIVRLKRGEGAEPWSGTIDIPQQGASNLALADVKAEGGRVSFVITGVPGNPTFDGKLAGRRIEGDFTQGTAKLTFWLSRDRKAAEELARPQDPKPPLPYREEDVTYSNGDVTLAGTLTLPPGAGPFPAAILISGSGPQNRDEELFNHRPFRVIADHLTRRGVAVLRVDDRGIGKSTGKFEDATTEDFAADVLAGVTYMKSRNEVDAAKIGLIGHSEGGVIAPMVAARSKDVAYIVLLAGTGVSGDEVLFEQNRRILAAMGAPQDAIEQQVQMVRRLCEAIRDGVSDDELRDIVRQMVREQIGAGVFPGGNNLTEEQINSMADAQAKSVGSKWFRFFVTYDPRESLAKVTVPALAMVGERDTQVDADQNLPRIEEALKAAGNKDVTLHRLAELNHLFQHCETGAPTEYFTIDETFSEDAMKLISDWIAARFGAKK